MQSWLLITALLLMLIEALVARTGWHLPEWAFAGWQWKRREKPKAAVMKHQARLKTPEPAVANEPAAAPPTVEPTPADRQRRFDRAKRK
jgi:hypothetical protein